MQWSCVNLGVGSKRVTNQQNNKHIISFMEFKTWLDKIKIDEQNLEIFITKLELYFSDSGFNGLEFERKVTIGLQKIDVEIDELLKPEINAEDQ